MGLLWDSADEKERRRELQREAKWLKSDYEAESRYCAGLVKDTMHNYFTNNGLFYFHGRFEKYAKCQRIHEISYYGDAYDSDDYRTVFNYCMESWFSQRSANDPELARCSSEYKDIIGWVGSSCSYDAKNCVSLLYKIYFWDQPKAGEVLMASFDGAYKLHKASQDISSNEEKLKAALEQLQNYRG